MDAAGPRILVVDAAGRGSLAALVQGGVVRQERRIEAGLGIAAALPGLLAAVLADGMPDLVAVTVGPGSFTGIRAALSLAHGIAAAAQIGLIGVSVPEALMQEPAGGGFSVSQRVRNEGRTLLVALGSRRGRIFLDRGDGPKLVALTELPVLEGPATVVGDAARELVDRIGRPDFVAGPPHDPRPLGIAAAALLRHRGLLPALAPNPLYIEAPEARTSVLRPAPV